MHYDSRQQNRQPDIAQRLFSGLNESGIITIAGQGWQLLSTKENLQGGSPAEKRNESDLHSGIRQGMHLPADMTMEKQERVQMS